MKPLIDENIRFIILHHSAFEHPDNSTALDEVDRIRSWHKQRGFSDIGYHRVVYRNSFAPARNQNRQGAHCRGYNAYSLGVCLCADLTKRLPTEDEVIATASAVLDLEHQFQRRFMVLGHKDVAATLCPGPDLVSLVLDEIGRTNPCK